jgi:hypothetical protein
MQHALMKVRRTDMNKSNLYFLRAFFSVTLLTMLYVAITATNNQNIFEAVRTIWPNWWFRATLTDAYLGFLTFYVWVAYKEIHLWRKILWFTLIVFLGNVAISAYMLLELYKLRVGETFATLLTRRNGK